MLIKPIIKNLNTDDTRKLCSFTVKHPIFNDLRVETRAIKENNYGFITEIKNAMNKIIGIENFSLYKDRDHIDGFLIKVEYEYRRKFKIGEILRLASIIEMIENKMNSIKIYSKSSAVYFHSKYKFRPDIKSFEERNKFLENVAGNPNPEYLEYKDSAINFLDRIAKRGKSAKAQRELCKEVNVFAKKYLNKVLSGDKKEYKKYPFEWGISMELTKDDVYKNKDFFNSLFEKHGIDYKI